MAKEKKLKITVETDNLIKLDGKIYRQVDIKDLTKEELMQIAMKEERRSFTMHTMSSVGLSRPIGTFTCN